MDHSKWIWVGIPGLLYYCELWGIFLALLVPSVKWVTPASAVNAPRRHDLHMPLKKEGHWV